jgi:hypothetical protein
LEAEKSCYRHYPDEESARLLARKVFTKHSCDCPVDVKDLVYSLGIDIVYADPPFPNKVLGAFISLKEEYGKGLIILQPNIMPERERFTIAHELYHALIRPNLGFFSPDQKALKTHEREANIFASELLMPKNKVLSAYNSGCRTISSFAEIFWVSKQAMEIRLQEVGLGFLVGKRGNIGENQEKYFF